MLVPLLAVLGACAEGGIRGSGISTSVVGNVASVTPGGPVAGVRVAIVGSGVATTTDSGGGFSLVGPFDGMLTVRFAPPGGGTAALPINVPAAGVLTLDNVHVDTAEGTATAEREQVDFAGVVVDTDCGAATLTLESAATAADGGEYEVDLTTSMLQDAQGQPVPCESVQAGTPATVSGDVYPSGVFGHCTVVLTE
jgi:hypothetical protein